MKRALLLAMSLVVLVACADEPKPHAVIDGREIELDPLGTPGVPGNLYRVTVEGMPCILWMDSHEVGQQQGYTYSGITCDWSAR